MKKSLSLLLAIAMVFSMFASVASAADELTAEQKYDALASKGIFSGIDGEKALDQDMTRAQFARVVSLLLELDLNNPPATASFSDVQPGHWAFEEVEAVLHAEVMSGYSETVFGDKDNITIEQMARVYVDALGLAVDEEAEVEGASEWAQKYVKAAVDAGLISADAEFTANASRAQLAEVSYAVAGKVGIFEPAKVSVVSAEPTGVQEITVTLDKTVSVEDAKFTVKRESSNVEIGEVVWSEDGRTVTIPLEQKIREGNYTVTLSGIAAEEIATDSASFEAQDETVEAIEFVTSSDYIAKSTNAKVKLRAENQYGELASFSATFFTANAMNLDKSLTKDDEGYLILTLDTSDEDLLTNVSVIPIYVYFDDNRVTAQKTFTVGTKPFVSAMELGEVEYSNADGVLSDSGETAEVGLYLYDQYGNPVTPEQVDADDIDVSINSYITPFNTAIDLDNEEVDTVEDQYLVVATVNENEKIEKNETLGWTVYAGSASATTDLKVGVGKVAMNVRVGDIDSILAEGDTDKKYVTLHVTDANGEELSPQEIVDNADRIRVTASGGITLAQFTEAGETTQIVKYGSNKGKARIDAVTGAADSYAFITAQIVTQNANSHHNRQFKIDDARVPDSVEVTTKPAEKAVRGGDSDFDFQVRDQYGEEMDYAGSDYYVELTVTGDTYGAAVELDDEVASTTYTAGAGESLTFDNTTLSIENFNNGFSFQTEDGFEGEVSATATLYDGEDKEVDKATVKIELVDPEDTFYYSVGTVGDLYAGIDSELLPTEDPSDSVISKKVEVTVKDASGKKVAYPNMIRSVTAGNPNVAKVEQSGGEAFVLGDEAGSTSVTVIFEAADGTTKSLTSSVTVKNENVKAVSGSAEDEVDIADATVGTEVSGLIDLKVKDQYGIEYENTEIYDYDNLLGVRYTVTDITGTGGVQITENADGTSGFEITTRDGGVTSFVINAVNRDGEILASTVVMDLD